MDPWIPRALKKRIREIAGHDLSFKQLQEYIELSPERENLIIQIAYLLRQPDIQTKKTWHELKVKFMQRYGGELIRLLDVKPGQIYSE